MAYDRRRMGRVQDDNGSRPHEPTAGRDAFTEEALDWFAKLQHAAGDRHVAEQFDAWRESDARRAEAFRRVEALWNSSELRAAVKASAAPSRTTASATRSAPRRGASARWSIRLAVAAAVVILAVAVAKFPDFMLSMRADYRTAAGESQKISLPDGSVMTLNTASSVSLDFADGRRAVTLLSGEAFFQVVHDPQHPFRVTGHLGDAEVKGTAFSVRTDETEDKVLVREGLVDAGPLESRQTRALLAAGHGAIITKASMSPMPEGDTERELAWLDGRISFVDRPFGRVLDDLRRYYGGRIIVTNDRLKRTAVSGDYRLDNPELVIRSLAEATGAKFTRLPGGIIFLR